jgi:hypothetical protein
LLLLDASATGASVYVKEMREILVCLACGVDTDSCSCTGTRPRPGSGGVTHSTVVAGGHHEQVARHLQDLSCCLGEQTGAGKQTDRFVQPKATATNPLLPFTDKDILLTLAKLVRLLWMRLQK